MNLVIDTPKTQTECVLEDLVSCLPHNITLSDGDAMRVFRIELHHDGDYYEESKHH